MDEHDFEEDPRTAAGLRGRLDSTEGSQQLDLVELLLRRIEELERRVERLEKET